MQRLGVSLLPLGSIVRDHFANSHGMSDHIPDKSLETVEDLRDAGVGFAGVLPPGADALRLLLQRLDDLRDWKC